MKSIISLVIFLFSIIPVFSQNYLKIDSLRKALTTEKNIDEQSHIITNLLIEYIALSRDSANMFIKNTIQKIDDKDKQNQLMVLMSIGDAYRKSNVHGSYSFAITFYQKAFSIAKEIKQKLSEGLCLLRIGDIYMYQGLYSESLDNLLQALAIFQEISDTSRSEQTILSISNVYGGIGDYVKALEFQLKVLNNVNKDKTHGDIAYFYFNIANSYLSLKTYDKALDYLWKSENLFESIGRDDFVTRCYEGIGDVYYLQNDYLQALKYYLKSNEKVRETYTWDISNINGKIASVYIKLGQYNKALPYCKKEFKYAMEINSKDMIQFGAENLSNIYIGFKDYRSALKYYKISIAYKDSLNLEESRQKIMKLEMKNEFTSELHEQELIQKQKEAEINAKMEQQKLIRNFAIGGIILLLFGLYFAIRSFNIKRKSNDLLAMQKQEIEEKNMTLHKQNEHIEYIHLQVTQSINYAKRIQSSIFPDDSLLYKYFSDHFIMLHPKDNVSGDFYWWAKISDSLVVAVADCTGHGVPGAFMSMLGISFLREIVTKEYTTKPDVILNKLREEIINTLKQEGKVREQKDGMDIALISINLNDNVLQFAGSNNPLYIIRNGNLIEIIADKMPISIYDKMDKFTNNEFQLIKGDNLYLFSDGFADQFGGESHKKFKYNPFQDLLVLHATKPMNEQKENLHSTFLNWKNSTEQTDDVLVIGLKI